MSRASRNVQPVLETAQEVSSQRSGSENGDGKKTRPQNPFKVPDEKEFYAMKNKAPKNGESGITTSLSQIKAPSFMRTNYRSWAKIQPPEKEAEEEALGQMIMAPEANQVQEGHRDFILQKREIFRSQLAIDTKREELQRLERLEREEEGNLKAKEAEINLFRDQFRSFLENDGKATMEARHAAEVKSKQRIEVSMQIKQVSSQISSLRNEIAHHDEKLQECQEYKKFLDSLTPPDWRKQNPQPEMYFKDPQQLLTIMVSLEEQNMFLIRHCQEAEEAVERYRTKFNELLESRDGSITEMLDRKNKKNQELADMDARNEQYRVTGEFHHGNELSDAELSKLQEAINNFHKQLGFDAASSNDTATMLRRIESKMEELTFILSRQVNQDTLKELAQQKELARRNQERTLKNIQQKKEQEEKTQKAIALAMMPIKKRTGRPLMERMVPKKEQSREKREEAMRLKIAQEEADNDLLYGQIWD